MTDQPQGGRMRDASFVVVVAIWLGMLVGVSFLATSAKFLAPSLTLPVALDVGRHTFAVFNKVEWAFAAVSLLMFIAGRRAWTVGAALAVTIGLLLAETVWLLPVLDARVGMIMAGQQPPLSQLHTLFIAFEAVRVVALLVAVGDAARRLVGAPRAHAS
ncbi:MAG: hypothetical protein AB7O60_02530 [Variibacter sp.]